MFIHTEIDRSRKYYGKLVMILGLSRFTTENLPDEDILKTFTNIPEVEGFVISGTAGVDPIDHLDSIRSFIFAARKYFSPGTRPPIIVRTNYSETELNRKFFSGLESEFHLYGNVILHFGWPIFMRKEKYYTKLQHE